MSRERLTCAENDLSQMSRVLTGWERDGGFAEALLVPARRHLLPLERLDPLRAAPLADAGVTPHRAVRRIAPFLGRGAVAVVIGAGGFVSSRSSTCGS
jgi:propanol-preferring alcohol dehydrogenase